MSATRARKNARFLQQQALRIAGGKRIPDFSQAIPFETLSHLHLETNPADKVIDKDAKALLSTLFGDPKVRFPSISPALTGPLFNGTIYFAQISFTVQNQNNTVLAVNTGDMQTAVSFARLAAVPISEYSGQYGPNSVAVSSSLLTLSVTLPTASYTDADLHGWVNTIVQQNSLPAGSCVAVISPPGITNSSYPPPVGGYHGTANVPFLVVYATGSGFSVADQSQQYALVLSHEMAEMIVDPQANLANPEVCDPCGPNCQNVFVSYFGGRGDYIATVQATTYPPKSPDFPYSFLINAIVSPGSSTHCPAPGSSCDYRLPFQKFLVETGTTFAPETDGAWLMANWVGSGNKPDLVFVKTNNTPNGHVEVHVASGQSNYQTRVDEVPTTFNNENDGVWLMANWVGGGNKPDLVFVKTSNTPSGRVEVHVASGNSNYQQRVDEIATTFANESDGTWLMTNWVNGGKKPDLVFIKTSNTPSGRVEVHIASGDSNYQTRLLETPTTFGDETDGIWTMADWDGDGIPDLVFIKTSNTPSGRVEVHIASGKSNFQTRILEVATPFGSESDGNWLMAPWDGRPNLVFLKTANTGTNTVEVHIVS